MLGAIRQRRSHQACRVLELDGQNVETRCAAEATRTGQYYALATTGGRSVDSIATVVVSAVIGAAVAYVGSVWQARLAARRVIHERVHESRARLYPIAWKITGRLPRRPRTEEHTYKTLKTLAIDLRDWFYEEGGMYLSGGSRDEYSEFLDVMEKLTTDNSGEDVVREQDYERARRAGSSLRDWMTKDLLSRSRAPLGHGWKRRKKST